MTTTTIADRLADGLEHLVDRGADRLGRIVDELDLSCPAAVSAWIAGSSLRTAAADVERVGRRRREDADEGAGLAVEADDARRARRRRARSRATSRSRTTSSPFGAQRQRAEGLRRLQRRLHRRSSRRRTRSRSCRARRGSSRRVIAASTSVAVTPRAASCTGSIQTRMAKLRGADDLRPRRRPRSSTCAAG